VGVVEVEGMIAVCNGGGGALGHPTEYIELNTVTPNTVSSTTVATLSTKIKGSKVGLKEFVEITSRALTVQPVGKVAQLCLQSMQA
jgi:hypothetical protein